MKRVLFAVAISSIACGLLSSSPAQAAPPSRVFVSAQGSDGNSTCSFGAPCRTFQHAHDVVGPGGEIDVLDPAGYGALVINKAISIQGHGFAGITVASSGTGISISAAATDNVSLNGLLIDGGGAGDTGIAFSTGGALSIQNCVVRNFVTNGLSLSETGTAQLTLVVSNSSFTESGSNGIVIGLSGSGNVFAAIDRTVLSGNGGSGLTVSNLGGGGAVFVAVNDSIAANNFTATNALVGFGFLVTSTGGHSAFLGLTRASATGNTTGIRASGSGATLEIGQSTVRTNGVGFAVSGGVINSYGDNYIDNNFSLNSGTLTPASPGKQ